MGVQFHPQPLRQQAAPPGQQGEGAASVPHPPQTKCPRAALAGQRHPLSQRPVLHIGSWGQTAGTTVDCLSGVKGFCCLWVEEGASRLSSHPTLSVNTGSCLSKRSKGGARGYLPSNKPSHTHTGTTETLLTSIPTEPVWLRLQQTAGLGQLPAELPSASGTEQETVPLFLLASPLECQGGLPKVMRLSGM